MPGSDMLVAIMGLCGLLALGLGFFLMMRSPPKKEKVEADDGGGGGDAQAPEPAGRGRGRARRRARAAGAGAGAGAGANDDAGNQGGDDGAAPAEPEDDEDWEGLSARERRKKEKKAAKRAAAAQRDQMRTRKDEKQAAYRAKQAARDEEYRRKEEQERLAEEARKKEEEDEYNSWAEGFTVEASGEADSPEEQERKLEEFIEHIKRKKVVVLEDLAAKFGLRSKDVLERVQRLEQLGRLTGVVDDRGKFIFITPEEMDKVAQFVRDSGRVSIAELATRSNEFVDLTETDVPDVSALDDEDDEDNS